MSEELPSINDFIEDRSNLPSVETFTEGALPVKKSTVDKTEDNIVEENIPQVIREQPDNTALIVSLIENVRNSIPEVKSYDQELYDIVKLIEQLKNDVEDSKTEKTVLMESNGYDKDVLREELNDIRNSIPTVPEVKYYDQEIRELQEAAKREFDYGEQYKKLTETVLDVRDRANVDHSWIRSTFSNIDDNFDSVTSSLATVKGKLEMEVSDILESMETTAFETKVDRTNLTKKIDDTQQDLTETKELITSNVVEFKDKIYKELKEASLRIWNLNKAYQKDDVKLQEQLDEQYSQLKESITNVIETGDKKYDKLNRFYDILKEQIIDLPEIKNYDEEIKRVDHSVYTIKNLVTEIDRRLTSKVNKIKLDMKEGLLNIPPNLDNVDPLTPLDQNFATLDDLSNHYRLFMNRIQTQLATLGGGGAVWLWDLDDVNIGTPDGSGYPPIPDGNLLIYDASANNWVGIASTALTPGDTTLQHVLETDNIAGLGMSVGFITATGMNVSGNVTIGGTLTYEDVKNVDAIGLITARSGINVTGGSVVVQTGNLSVAGVTTLGVTTVTDLTARNLDVTGIATFGTTSVVIDGNNDLINVGTGLTLGSVEGVLAPNLVVSGVSTLGIVTGLTSLQVTDLYSTTSRITGDVIIDGDVSIAGTLTKKDVTEINSVGLITANNGINVVGGNIDVLAGDVYVSGMVTATDGLFVGVVTATSVVVGTTTDHTLSVTGKVDSNLIPAQNQVYNLGKSDSKWNNVYGNVVHSTLLTTNKVSASSSVTAASFYGDGSGLTGLANTDRITTESLVVLGVTTSLGGIVVDRTSVPNNILTAKLNGVTKAQIIANGNAEFQSTTVTNLVAGVTTATGLDINGDADISGNLNIGGILTYDDVTNIDSVGMVTARNGVRITSGGLNVVGVTTVATMNVGGDITLSTAQDIGIIDNSGLALRIMESGSTEYLRIVTIDGSERIETKKTLETDGLLSVGGGITMANTTDIQMADNSGFAFRIREGNNEYMRFTTTDGGEKIVTKKALEVDGALDIDGAVDCSGQVTFSAAQTITIPDNLGFGLRVSSADNAEFVRFTTTDGSELIDFSKKVKLDGGLTLNSNIDAQASSVDITMISGNSNAIDFVIDGGDRMMRFNTNQKTVILEQKLEVQGQSTLSNTTAGIVTATQFIGPLTGTASNATLVSGTTTSFLLDYNNFTNTPTIVTSNEVRDNIQGYYGYTTDYYTVGVANTVQTIGAGVTTLIQPQVAAVYQYMPTVMSGVNTNPYIGAGATIGTGQTQFSLAGLGTGASCIVRTALAFNPDVDNTNLDVQLRFTTNTATQGTGLTHFTVLKEQALIMNEGADQQYISENLFSFFVGETLEGTTQSNAGSFNIEVIPSDEGELEVLAVTVNVTT